MMPFVIVLQAAACFLLIVVILMQSGRGGGLTDSFASAENMFGAKTNEVMVKVTVILACLFLVTNLIIVRLSSRREKSLFEQAGANKPTADAVQKTPDQISVTTNEAAQ